MASVNKVILVGNLGADPETRYAASGDAICNIRLATTDSWKDKNSGEKREVTEWHRVVLYRMIQKVMICGVDCHPGDANCNNYCNHDKSKPMADNSPAATPEMQLASARRFAHEKLREAEKAWYEYFGMCEAGADRERAAQVYENVRTATRP